MQHRAGNSPSVVETYTFFFFWWQSMIQTRRFHLCRLWPFATRLNKSTATMGENLSFASPFLKITPWGWNRDHGKAKRNPKARWRSESAPLPLSCLWNSKDKTPRSYFIQSKSLVLTSKPNNKRCQYLFLIQSPLSKSPVPPRCSVNKLNKRAETAWKRSFNCAGMPHQRRLNQSSFYRCINLHATKAEM